MKPRIKRVQWLWIFRRWKYYGNRAVGYGKTPMDAYIHWNMCNAYLCNLI